MIKVYFLWLCDYIYFIIQIILLNLNTNKYCLQLGHLHYNICKILYHLNSLTNDYI